jgi:hypothetical protein
MEKAGWGWGKDFRARKVLYMYDREHQCKLRTVSDFDISMQVH